MNVGVSPFLIFALWLLSGQICHAVRTVTPEQKKFAEEQNKKCCEQVKASPSALAKCKNFCEKLVSLNIKEQPEAWKDKPTCLAEIRKEKDKLEDCHLLLQIDDKFQEVKGLLDTCYKKSDKVPGMKEHCSKLHAAFMAENGPEIEKLQKEAKACEDTIAKSPVEECKKVTKMQNE